MAVYVTDTHPLVWYAVGQHGKLSSPVRERFDLAWKGGQIMIFVPPVVIWEISTLEKAGKIKLRYPISDWCRYLLQKSGFELAPFDHETICVAHHLNLGDDIFDSMIVATAVMMELPLITRDLKITESKLVEILW